MRGARGAAGPWVNLGGCRCLQEPVCPAWACKGWVVRSIPQDGAGAAPLGMLSPRGQGWRMLEDKRDATLG